MQAAPVLPLNTLGFRTVDLMPSIFASTRTIAATYFALLLSLVPAQAQQNEIAARVDAAVQGWMDQYSIADSEVALAQHGQLIGSLGHGWKPGDKQPVASLSKAITGFCAAKLMDQGKIRPQDTLGQVLGTSIMMPKDPRFASITIEQLLTHRSGLSRNAFDDAKDHNVEESFASATQAPLDNDPGSTVSYSDSAYLVLGYVIQHVAKARYEDVCSQVFTDAGLPKTAGVIDPTLAARAPNGGWAIDAEDYAKLLVALEHFGTASKAWLQGLADDDAYFKNGPCARFHEGQAYGFGFCRKHSAQGIAYYHDGLLHFHPPFYKKTGGSFFFVNEQGVAAVVIFSGENGGDAYKALENAVIQAMHAKS